MEVPSTILLETIVITFIVILVAQYFTLYQAYMRNLKISELEITALEIVHHISETMIEALKTNGKISRNILIGTPFKAEIKNATLTVYGEDMSVSVKLTESIGNQANKIKISYDETRFATYNVTVIVDFTENQIKVTVG